jgi:SAM-dependent methyltransferase
MAGSPFDPVAAQYNAARPVAQSWHWFDSLRAGAEVARVLRPGGHWAAWWNQAAAERSGPAPG